MDIDKEIAELRQRQRQIRESLEAVDGAANMLLDWSNKYFRGEGVPYEPVPAEELAQILPGLATSTALGIRALRDLILLKP